jgi:hypothetical protein
MRIATLNIDWAKTQKKKAAIEAELSTQDFNILILTEAIPLDLPVYGSVYPTTNLPREQYEGMNYTLVSNPACRVIIYSKYISMKTYEVSDPFTSVCHQFDTEDGSLTIYATIVGTLFRSDMGLAKKELDNCIKDCALIAEQANNLCLVGDLNTSFGAGGSSFQLNGETTNQLKDLCKDCSFVLTTSTLKDNIDHIFMPVYLKETSIMTPGIFVAEGTLSDHQGVYVAIQPQ